MYSFQLFGSICVNRPRTTGVLPPSTRSIPDRRALHVPQALAGRYSSAMPGERQSMHPLLVLSRRGQFALYPDGGPAERARRRLLLPAVHQRIQDAFRQFRISAIERSIVLLFEAHGEPRSLRGRIIPPSTAFRRGLTLSASEFNGVMHFSPTGFRLALGTLGGGQRRRSV